MRRSPGQWLVLLGVVLVVAWWSSQGTREPLPAPSTPTDTSAPPSVANDRAAPTPAPEMHGGDNDSSLPAEAQETLRLIRAGGPFPHDRDGVVFGNYEGRLPKQRRGYYHEYTVPTPGLAHRGARRIVTGGEPPREFWYTDDHYESFRRIEATP